MWRSGLAKPKDARTRILVALERNLVTGFVVTGPATAPDCDPLATGEMYASLIPGARLVGEEEGQSPIAWQGGQLSKVIAAVAAEAAAASA